MAVRNSLALGHLRPVTWNALGRGQARGNDAGSGAAGTRRPSGDWRSCAVTLSGGRRPGEHRQVPGTGAPRGYRIGPSVAAADVVVGRRVCLS